MVPMPAPTSRTGAPIRGRVVRVFFGREVEDAAGHQTPGNVADAGADFEDGVAHMGAEFAGQPAQVLRSPGEIVEHAAAIGSGVEVVDQPELEDDTEGLDRKSTRL